jgi:hypothetical protein
MWSATSTGQMHSAAAAYSAAAAGVLYAGISAYWAVGLRDSRGHHAAASR